MGDAEWIECKKRSEVWKYFLIDKNDKHRVKCKKCPTILKYLSSTTSMYSGTSGRETDTARVRSSAPYYMPQPI